MAVEAFRVRRPYTSEGLVTSSHRRSIFRSRQSVGLVEHGLDLWREGCRCDDCVTAATVYSTSYAANYTAKARRLGAA